MAPPCLRQRQRNLAHVFLPAGHNDLRLSAHDRCGTKGDGLQSGTADLVDGQSRRLLGYPGTYGGLTGGVLPQTGLQNVAHNHLIDGERHGGIIPDIGLFFGVGQTLILQCVRPIRLHLVAGNRTDVCANQGIFYGKGTQVNGGNGF